MDRTSKGFRARRQKGLPGPHTILTALAATCIASGAAHADPLQNQVLAGMRGAAGDTYAFRRTLEIERTGAPRKIVTEQFDPRRAAAERWSLASVDGHAPTPKEAADYRKSKHGRASSYVELAKWFGTPAQRSETAPGYVTYRFARLPAGTVKVGSHDASADMRAEALVNTTSKLPFVERVRLSTTKGFRMMLVASVERMVVDQRYRLLADGHVVPGDATSELAGSLMGKAGQMHTSMRYSEVQPVR